MSAETIRCRVLQSKEHLARNPGDSAHPVNLLALLLAGAVHAPQIKDSPDAILPHVISTARKRERHHHLRSKAGSSKLPDVQWSSQHG